MIYVRMMPIGVYCIQSVKAGKKQVSSIKVTKLTKEDDIEVYLTTFECLMKAYEIKEERWAFELPTAC